MRASFVMPAASLLVSLAACAPESQPPGALPVSTDPRGGQEEPQPANSLPPGAAVNAPITRGSGDISTTGGLTGGY